MTDKRLDDFIKDRLILFHDKRLKGLQGIKLASILKRKNPYLYQAKNILTAELLVRAILDAHLSSQEETLFGDFLEQLAIFSSREYIHSHHKSSAEGIDLEFDKDGIRYLVAIKSGPNWGNSQQIERMKDNFRKASRILRTNNPSINIRVVNGCCYGKNKQEDKKDYLKLCGQSFWHLITGKERFYLDIIEPITKAAKQKTGAFEKAYSELINKFTREFLEKYADAEGKINWETIVKLNSGRD